MHIHDLFDLHGRVAIVTGGGRGLGEQLAEALAEAGADLLLCSRKVEACREVADRLTAETGVKVIAMSCDIAQPEDVARVVERAMAEFGRIDILVNNSGATWGAPAVDMPLEAWRKVIDTNVTGTFLMSQAVGRVMIQQGGGKIINIASTAGFGGVDPRLMDAIGYNTSKGAILTFTKDLAVKWGPHGVTVNAIAPGFFPTKMSRGVLAQAGEALLAQTPLGRFGGDFDLKGAAVFLASAASDYMTGAVLTIDGGVSAHH
ncbi:short-chain dehydrogenase/reductase SDR [Alicyclobacillus hesperidum URH17-3-68]|uniref:SDR family oxidoreductase n=1 Tax=Alicyclobacillus hesperidum TaxID=89784 RepID=UPI000281AD48|nr:SDR family oxidoreductase [Alicyclobacillus hesperidum]EJY56948.1 short-chain dehydrogenase/reductase SDR [Alicyclobacillus hesperidum URH17-3-68]GLG02417.1 gluconate 5-dehydrogenase [Alicyclobacillus hesperidum subsp. aegles]